MASHLEYEVETDSGSIDGSNIICRRDPIFREVADQNKKMQVNNLIL